MTKKWDLVKETIRVLSVEQKKSLEEVKEIMESRHQFRASTRAYRMKLKEWGYLRHRSRNDMLFTSEERRAHHSVNAMELVSDRTTTITPDHEEIAHLDEVQDLVQTRVTPFNAVSQPRGTNTEPLMEILSVVLTGDSEELEALLMANSTIVNLPIGQPFDVHGGRFFNHPALRECLILQHPGQTIYDIACALNSVPVVWILKTYGAHGSTHPLGTDLALHNAIKNGRTHVVQALLHSGGSNANGIPGTTWKPLIQATYWNMPQIVRLLLDKGAAVNDGAPAFNHSYKTALQFALERRANQYVEEPIRERCEKIIKMLLDAGANIHLIPAAEGSDGAKAFESFIEPWKSNPLWYMELSTSVADVLKAFLRKGADLRSHFNPTHCEASTGSTFEHQALWHASPSVARMLVNHAPLTPTASGCNILHEIVGSCPDARRQPSETLRDMESMFQRGADPNWQGTNGSTPLTTCLAACPSIDIVERVKLLLKRGADPEMSDNNGSRPIVLAARAFEEPIRSSIMHLLVSKYKGRHSPMDQFAWDTGFFPVPSSPDFARVLRYSRQDGEFEVNLQKMLPEPTIPVFQKAAFSVASENYLRHISRIDASGQSRASIRTAQGREEIMKIMQMRQAIGIADFQFDQRFVLSLLSVPYSVLQSSVNNSELAAAERPISIASSRSSSPRSTPDGHRHTKPVRTAYNDFSSTQITSAQTVPETSTSATALVVASAIRPDSPSSTTSSHQSSNRWFVPDTTTIQFPNPGTATDAEMQLANDNVKYIRCQSCRDGVLLSKKDYEWHENEHWHSLHCKDAACMRRFCFAQRP